MSASSPQVSSEYLEGQKLARLVDGETLVLTSDMSAEKSQGAIDEHHRLALEHIRKGNLPQPRKSGEAPFRGWGNIILQ